MTLVSLSDSMDKIQVLTQNFDMNRWIDGIGDISHRQFTLTLSLSEVNAGECIYLASAR